MGSGNFTLRPYLGHLKVGLVVASIAVVLSSVNGMVASIDFLLILKRLPVFVLVFGFFGYGVSYLFQLYLPELLQEFHIKKDKSVPVDITLSEENPHKTELSDDRVLTKGENEDNSPVFSDVDANNKKDEPIIDVGNKMDKNTAPGFDNSAKLAQVIRNVINREE